MENGGEDVGLHGDEYSGNISGCSVAERHWDIQNLCGSETILLAVKSSHSSAPQRGGGGGGGGGGDGEVSERAQLWSEAQSAA